jgi:integrase
VKEILNSFDESDFNGLRDKTIVLTFLMTGMRLAGVESIRRDTFDLETGVGKTIEKGDKERDILLTPQLKEQLKKYAEKRDSLIGNCEWMWVTSDGKRFNRGGIKEMVQSLKRFNSKVHPHMFRHLFAKAMYENKVPMQNIMTYGGWASLEMVMRYAKDYQSKVHWEEMKGYKPFDRWDTGKGQADDTK